MAKRKIQYSVQYDCGNCGWKGLKKFDVGKSAPSTATCTRCGCPTARKSLAVPYVPKRPTEPDCPPTLPMPGPTIPEWDNRWYPPGPFVRPRRWWDDPCAPSIFYRFEERSD